MLQETHSTPSDENIWQSEWGGKILFSHGKSNSKGVAILFPNIDYDIIDTQADNDGRYIMSKIIWEKTEYCIVNCYAPTRDHRKEQLDFIEFVKTHICHYANDNMIIAGDFNLYMNKQIDKLDTMSDKSDNAEYRKEINSILDVLELVDIWRLYNPDIRRYTWHCRGKASRLDYMFVSEHILNTIHKCDILPGTHSDHSILLLQICLNTDYSVRGKGYWKFNNTLLHDPTYVALIKNSIEESSLKYEYLDDKALKWEMIKLDIRTVTVPYCIKQKKEAREFKKQLQERYNTLSKLFDGNPELQNIEEELISTKNQIENIEKQEVCATIFRSKVKWTELGEQNTKYFLNLEKKNFINKVITQLEINNTIISEPKDILNEQNNYYKNLYSEKLDINDLTYKQNLDYFMDVNIKSLTEEQKLDCDKPISEQELLKSIKALKNGKTPGSDGLTTDFYKFFWSDIKYYLLESYTYALHTGQLSIEQRRGVLSLIPKKNKNRLFLKNWRPISLLNTDYKIIAKLLALRLTNVLPSIIDEDQTGYIRHRYIGQNIRMIEDVCYFTETKNIPGIILSIDFEKAFDTLNWNFMFAALEKFNFGRYFTQWISILYIIQLRCSPPTR